MTIWEIQICKYGRDPKDFDLVQLSRATEGLTGSEIENVFLDALFLAFDSRKEPTDLDITQVLTEFVPYPAELAHGVKNYIELVCTIAKTVIIHPAIRHNRNFSSPGA